MSGAAGIAAAKNRRSKAEANQKQLPPPISCGKNNSCPPQKTNTARTASNATPNAAPNTMSTLDDLVDPTSLQILGPMPPVQILRLHEQRLNRFDERFSQMSSQPSFETMSTLNEEELVDMDECYNRVDNLESKVAMLEEVIMTLQNKLTIAQNFAMETNLSMSALIKKQEQLHLHQQASIGNVVDITSAIEDSIDNSVTKSSPTTSESPSE